jgi:hypothetical protein
VNFDHFKRFIEPYQHLDPSGWVGLYAAVPVWLGFICAALGLVMIPFGGRALFRLTAGPLGAVLAAAWAGPIATQLGFGGSANQVTIVAIFALFGVGLIVPSVVVYFAFGIPGGLYAGHLAGKNDWLLGFAPGFLLAGAVGVVLQSHISAILSAMFGAWLLVLGSMAALAPWVPGVARLAGMPLVVISIAGVIAIGGSVYQLFVRPAPEVAEKRKHERFMRKRRATEERELLERWSKKPDKM